MFDLSLSDDGHLARLTLRAPERLNALRREDWRALADLLNQRVSPLPDLRALLICGEGPRAFCAGGDIKEFADIRLGADAAQAYNHDVDQASGLWQRCRYQPSPGFMRTASAAG